MSILKSIAGSAILGAGTLLLGTACHDTYVGVHSYDEPGYALTGGYYDYTYYPDTEVYFYPRERVYYWHDHDGWRHGRDLPRQVHVERDRSVSLHLQTAKPYEQHATIRGQHPPTRHDDKKH